MVTANEAKKALRVNVGVRVAAMGVTAVQGFSMQAFRKWLGLNSRVLEVIYVDDKFTSKLLVAERSHLGFSPRLVIISPNFLS